MNNNFISIKNVSKIINGTKILDNINACFYPGKIYGIVGKNASGKTMLFKSICGLVNITSGSITVLGKLISNGRFPDDTGVIIESPGFLPQYTGFKNLQILASIKNKITSDQIKNNLIKVGLNPDDKRPTKKYSLGMKQKLGIAQAIMEKPKVLILDEPMNALDNYSVQNIYDILLEFKKSGTIILLSSHHKEDIDYLCDEICLISSGKLTIK